MRNRNIDEAELRRLMAADDGRAATDPGQVTAVAALLAAAAGVSGRASEVADADRPLPGEEAALAAFRAAQPAAANSPAPARRRLEWLRPGRRGRTVTFAMAFAALLGSGVAVAAGVTGHMTLPLPFHHPQPTQSATPTPSASASTDTPQPPPSHTAPDSGGLPQPGPTTTPQHPTHHGPRHPAQGHAQGQGEGQNQGKGHSHSPSPHATGNEGHHQSHSTSAGHQPTLPPNTGHPHTQQPHTRCHPAPSCDPTPAHPAPSPPAHG